MKINNSTLSRNAETKDFAGLNSHPVRGWTGKNKDFLFSWDSKWPPCDKGLLKIYDVGFCLFSCPNFAFELNSFHRKS